MTPTGGGHGRGIIGIARGEDVLAAHPWLRTALRAWGWVRRELWACFKDPGADDERAAHYLSRQFTAVVRHLPLTTGGTCAVSLALTVGFWHQAGRAVLVPWATALWSICAAQLLVWRLHQRMPVVATRVAVAWLTASFGLSALLYALMLVYLFRMGGENERLALAAVTAAIMSIGGWLLACLPLAGMTWVLVLCGGIAAGLWSSLWDSHAFVVALAAVYGLVLVGAVLATSRLFLASLKSETAVERQRHIIDVLLRDYEEHASDWLWEADRDGRLRYVSPGLAEALGAAPAELRGQPFVEVVASLSGQSRPPDTALFDRLRRCLAGASAFSRVVVPVRLSAETRWWSLTAKPLADVQSGENGWRGICSDITEARRRELELARLASVDTLTGLANRHRFGVHVGSYFGGATVSPCTLFLIDLDNFKAVNDSLGHAAGDALLQEVARRLSQAVDPESLLARFGGDEFALFHPAALSRTDAQRYGVRLQTALAPPCRIAEHRIHVHASIGVAVAPDDGETAEDLHKASNMALHAAKGLRGPRLRFFDRDMDRRARHKLSLLGDMREGLGRGEFSVVYQPQIDLASGRLAGFEALVRWRHEQHGPLLPADFVPLAEESGFIVPLGAWVLERACADAAAWPEDLWVAVNVSASQFTGQDVEASVNQALARSGLDTRRLELELTESTLMQDSEPTLALIHSLRRSGVRITLDDFGTGYSSLSYLRQLPLDKLKIDRSFTRTLGGPDGGPSLAVARTITQLAQAMNFQTTAEGIETNDQREQLGQLGCTFGQGYFFARPLDASQAAAYIAGHFSRDPVALTR
jgi:diguanylate cyclase (GGDEF)-like protein/PAS domain S-box-containing protein